MYQILVVSLFTFKWGVWGASDMFWEDTSGLLEVGSKRCKPLEYPFMVFFTDKKCSPTFCSGSLIASDWALTSKECVEQRIDINNCLAIAGTNYLSSDLWNDDTIRFICLLATTNSESNLGLVKIETVDPFPNHLYLIIYARESTHPNNMETRVPTDETTRGGVNDIGRIDPSDSEDELSFVLGFHNGPVSMRRMKGNASVIQLKSKKLGVALLKRVVVPLLSQEQCARNISELFVENSVLCTSCHFGGSKSCLMDTGGPLIYKGQVVGVMSGPQSNHCFLRYSVAVYTKVSLYSDWIDGVLQGQSKTESINYERTDVDSAHHSTRLNRSSGLLLNPLLLGLGLLRLITII